LLIARRLRELRPSDPLVQEALGRALLRSADAATGTDRVAVLADALSAYDTAAELDPNNGGYLHSAGIIASMIPEHLPQAIDRHRRAAERMPDEAAPPLFAGLAMARMGDSAGALEWLSRANELRPGDPTCQMAMADAMVRLGRGDAAIEMAASARALRPDDLDLRLLEARVSRLAGRPERARSLLLALGDAALARDAFARELAAAHTRAGELNPAAEALQRAAVAAPLRVDLAMECAIAWADAGHTEQARYWLDRCSSTGASDALLDEARTRVNEAIDRHQRGSSAP